ncbi:MAG: tautomerase family protein [Acidimicrobiales bacterium]|jgi:phenylpyruvate tautomerase PptA (4-oxalocrotonate tautomerase family)|nr:tautomerase family protein [Acidimicrobiales bacterium]
MAIARIELFWAITKNDRRLLIEGVADALVGALKVPPGDPTVIAVTRDAADVVLPSKVSDRYTIVTVTMFAGRTIETKRRLYQAIVHGLQSLGVPPDDVVIVLEEVPMENWGVDGGVPASEVDVGFKVDI